MTERDIVVPAAVLSLMRREDSARGLADRFGVTEAQVIEWHDIFVAAGIVALTEFRKGRLRGGPRHAITTTPLPDPGTSCEPMTTAHSATTAQPTTAQPTTSSEPPRRKNRR